MSKVVAAVLGAVVFISSCGASTSSATAESTTTVSPTTTVESTLVPAATDPPAVTTTAVASDAHGVLLGAYVEPRDGQFGDAARRQAVLDHEELIGRPLALVNEFFAFDKAWAIERLEWHIDSGRALMISWNGTDADRILSGSADETIRERAQWTRDLGVPVLLRFFWEPDAAKGERWGYHEDPGLYHEVWRHVRDIFEQLGAGNARWVWTPTTWNFTTGSAAEFYPGDDVVDVIGADGYLWSPCSGPVQSAPAVFADFLSWASDRPQPILIAEWSADSNPADATKAAFIDEMLDMAHGIDRLLGVVVFDSVDPGGRGCDWRIDSSPSALAAYRRLSEDPLFSGSASKLANL